LLIEFVVSLFSNPKADFFFDRRVKHSSVVVDLRIKNYEPKKKFFPFSNDIGMAESEIAFDFEIAILGCGRMGSAIVRGILDCDDPKLVQDRSNIRIYARHENDDTAKFRSEGCRIFDCALETCRGARVWILCVPKSAVEEVLRSVSHIIRPDTILMSTVVGCKVIDLVGIVGTSSIGYGSGPGIFRTIPNIAIQHRKSTTCISYRSFTEPDRYLSFVLKFFSALGTTVVVDDEEQLPVAVAISASGVAFFSRMIRSCSLVAAKYGTSLADAQKMILSTLQGTLTLLSQGNVHPEECIDRVITPGGCTIAGLDKMEELGLSRALKGGIDATVKKIERTEI
jgi:pyrroline-5-carboxylate reductase